LKLSLLAVAILICAGVEAQQSKIQKDSVTIIIRNLNGDIVKGNKIVNKYYLKNPKITIYTNLLKRGLVLKRDSVYYDSTRGYITELELSEIDYRLLENASFELSFEEPVDKVLYEFKYRGLELDINRVYSHLSKDKELYNFWTDKLCTECFIQSTIVSKKPIDLKLTL
jgi:hypothetical protein